MRYLLVSFIILLSRLSLSFFFFNDTATTEIYTLSLHDALPILQVGYANHFYRSAHKFEQICRHRLRRQNVKSAQIYRSEERFSRNAETDLVCRLLLEKKKKQEK